GPALRAGYPPGAVVFAVSVAAFAGVPPGALVTVRPTIGAGSTFGDDGATAERAPNGSRPSAAQVPTATIAARPATPAAMAAGRFPAPATGAAPVTPAQSPLTISLIQGRRAGSFSSACMTVRTAEPVARR